MERLHTRAKLYLGHEEDYYKVINVINDVHIIFHAA